MKKLCLVVCLTAINLLSTEAPVPVPVAPEAQPESPEQTKYVVPCALQASTKDSKMKASMIRMIMADSNSYGECNDTSEEMMFARIDMYLKECCSINIYRGVEPSACEMSLQMLAEAAQLVKEFNQGRDLDTSYTDQLLNCIEKQKTYFSDCKSKCDSLEECCPESCS